LDTALEAAYCTLWTIEQLVWFETDN